MTEPVINPGYTPSNSRVSLRIIGLLFIATGVFGWFVFTALFRNTPGQDWMVFDTAVSAWRRGDTGLLLDGPGFTAVLNATHQEWLRQPLDFHPWVYPPFTLLFVVPFCLLPFGASYILFQATTFFGMAVSLGPWTRSRREYFVVLAGVALCPATAFTLYAGQNSFLTASLLLGGMHLIPRRPTVAGVLLGLLIYKPQFAVLAPLALLALGAWVTIASAAGTAVALLMLSLLVPGLTVWSGWLHLFLSGDPAFHTWVNEGRMNGQSVFACLSLLGTPAWLANLGQIGAISFGIVSVWLAYRRDGVSNRRMAILLCATILAAPHVGAYDAILLGVASILVLMEGLTLRLSNADIWLAAFIWISTAVNPPQVFAKTIPLLFPIAELTPVALVALILCLLRNKVAARSA